MILQETYPIWSLFSIIFWGIAVAILVLCGVFYIYRSLKIGKGSEKSLLLGFGAVLIGYGVMAIIIQFNDLTLPGNFSNGTFYGTYDDLPLINQFFMASANVSSWVGYCIFFYELEKTINKTKFFITILIVFLIVLMYLVPLEIKFLIVRILTTINLFSFLILLYFITINSDISTKSISTFLLFGLIFLTLGTGLNGYDVKAASIPLYFSPLFLTSGAIIVTLPLLIPSRILTKSLRFWYGNIIANILLDVMLLTLFAFALRYLNLSTLVVDSFIIICVSSVGLYLDYKTIKQIKSGDSKNDISFDFFKAFSKKNIDSMDLEKIAQLQHIYIILKSGITIYSQTLEKSEIKEEDGKDSFLGSALSAIEMFLKEMYKSETVLKEVKLENISILIDEGQFVRIAVVASHDQKSLRKKMQTFLREFEKDYESILRENITDTRLFEPVNDLVDKSFK